jgi:predicted nucleotidyltransferase
MINRSDLLKYRDQILTIAKRHGASDVRIFGSVARGDCVATSDLDLIVRFEPERSLFDQGELLLDLQDLLHIKVDVIDELGMKPRFREQAMKDAVSL